MTHQTALGRILVARHFASPPIGGLLVLVVNGRFTWQHLHQDASVVFFPDTEPGVPVKLQLLQTMVFVVSGSHMKHILEVNFAIINSTKTRM